MRYSIAQSLRGLHLQKTSPIAQQSRRRDDAISSIGFHVLNLDRRIKKHSSLACSSVVHGSSFLPDDCMRRDGSRTRIAVGMSGGVDSSVAALLLKQAKEFDLDLVGIFMDNWDPSDEEGAEACIASREQDFSDAQSVCAALDIPIERVDFSNEYWNNVFVPFLDGYESGRTPNPDVFCNREIKFQCMQDFAFKELGAAYLATGHYARLRYSADDTAAELMCAADPGKDQTYFLSAVPGHRLRRAIFPLGGIQKARTRELAEEAQLVTSRKKESFGICFVGKRDFGDFISGYIDQTPGDVLCIETGKVIGRHKGLNRYTIGQRSGVCGLRDAMFTVSKDIERNTISVATKEHPSLYCSRIEVDSKDMYWINGPPDQGIERKTLSGKIRHREKSTPCTVSQSDDNGSWAIDFETPLRGVAPMQVAAIYDQEVCLGGGVIATAK